MNSMIQIKSIILALILLLSTATAFAKSTLDSMYEDPGRFIYYGGASIGLSFLIDRDSIESATSEDGAIVVSFDSVTHANNIQQEEVMGVKSLTYKFDTSTHQMFVFLDGWQYLDESKIDESREISNQISAGELAYYLATLEFFFDKIQSREAQRFVYEGRSMLPLVNLPNDGDEQIWHVYNHVTKEIEFWKWSNETQTGNIAFVRVK